MVIQENLALTATVGLELCHLRLEEIMTQPEWAGPGCTRLVFLYET